LPSASPRTRSIADVGIGRLATAGQGRKSPSRWVGSVRLNEQPRLAL
jgi:hypothetical protein